MATRQSLTVLVLLLCSQLSTAQTGINTPWYWRHGSYLANQPGIYVYDPQHPILMPGGRRVPSAWTSANGDLWLYGGQGFDANAAFGYLSDLWKYSGTQWTFVRGDIVKDVAAVFGTKEIAANSNNPGARLGSATWTDANGNLWLFGGLTTSPTYWNYQNDMWKYTISTNQWTWMNGDSTFNHTGVFGTMGISSPNNRPPARANCSKWIDNDGNFWLFGGSGPYDAVYNELWKYNPNTNEWTWIKGDSVIFQPGVYGTLGVPSPANKPGSRGWASAWTDGSGKVWIYGGHGFVESLFSGGGTLSDLWRYDPLTNEWTWMNGNKTLNAPTVYGQQGVANVSNKPGARAEAFTWTDALGNFWLFGGYGIGISSSYYGSFNDLWKYDPLISQWTWMKGDQLPGQPGLYNVGGVPGFVEQPGSRNNGACWTTNGTFWMFGGSGNAMGASFGYMNDLWVISSAQLTALPVVLVEFSASLQEKTVLLKWTTDKENAFSHFIVQRSMNGAEYKDVTAIYNCTRQNGTLRYYHYNDIDVQLSQAGKIFYRLKMVDDDGTATLSKVVMITETKGDINMLIYPNPVRDYLHLTIDAIEPEVIQIEVLNTNGAVLKKMDFHVALGKNTFDLDLHDLAASSYVLRVQYTHGYMSRSFVKLEH